MDMVLPCLLKDSHRPLILPSAVCVAFIRKDEVI